MARVAFLPSVNEDLRRIIGHPEQREAEHVQERLGEIVSASNVLTDNPLIGRLTHTDLRELVIGQGAHGYIALYRHVIALDTVFVLAIRAQREAGHAREE